MCETCDEARKLLRELQEDRARESHRHEQQLGEIIAAAVKLKRHAAGMIAAGRTICTIATGMNLNGDERF